MTINYTAQHLAAALDAESDACEILAREDLTSEEREQAEAHWANCVESLRHAARRVLR